MAIFSNAKKGFSGKIKLPSAFKTFKSVSAEPELMLDIFGVEAVRSATKVAHVRALPASSISESSPTPFMPQAMQELVSLPDGATGRTAQSRFDAEMIQVRALPALGPSPKPAISPTSVGRFR
jgi:hypothetical protein